MNRTTSIAGATGIVAALCAAATLLPGAASATDFVPRGNCYGSAVLHQTKGVSNDLHTWTYTVNGLPIGTNVSLEGITVGGHPATITVVGHYWKKKNADTSTFQDVSTTMTRPVQYPSVCAVPPPPPASTTTTTVPPAASTTTTTPPTVIVTVPPSPSRPLPPTE